MRAIDLYSGIGGWTKGLKLAGIEVVAAYEIWQPAIDTYNVNNGDYAQSVDIRDLDLQRLPKNINIVVGSPPCTQFSLSNRGGNGDIVDGIKDIRKFLEIVDFLQPRYWAMENVPRVEKILKREVFSKKGSLRRFAKLFPDGESNIRTINFAEFGLPQARKRCVAGDFPLALFSEYSKSCPRRTLGEVINALNRSTPFDPIYGIEGEAQSLSDHLQEAPLSDQETRLNSCAKVLHPVYNTMSFPDKLDRPSRTVTATCTKVSRESIVVRAGKYSRKFRRLTVRERLCLQGFPITFQLLSSGYSQKIKMAGNALPPMVGYYIGCAMNQIEPMKILHPWELPLSSKNPKTVAISSQPEGQSEKYSRRRRFRIAIPRLHFKSGVRFELRNNFSDSGEVSWGICFTFGTPKDIRSLILDQSTLSKCKKFRSYKLLQENLSKACAHLKIALEDYLPEKLQSSWTNSSSKIICPFDVVDEIDKVIPMLVKQTAGHELDMRRDLKSVLANAMEIVPIIGNSGIGLSETKVNKFANYILPGIMLSCLVNEHILMRDSFSPRQDVSRKIHAAE